MLRLPYIKMFTDKLCVIVLALMLRRKLCYDCVSKESRTLPTYCMSSWMKVSANSSCGGCRHGTDKDSKGHGQTGSEAVVMPRLQCFSY